MKPNRAIVHLYIFMVHCYCYFLLCINVQLTYELCVCSYDDVVFESNFTDTEHLENTIFNYYFVHSKLPTFNSSFTICYSGPCARIDAARSACSKRYTLSLAAIIRLYRSFNLAN